MVRLEKYQLPKLKPVQLQEFLSRFSQNENLARSQNQNYVSRRGYSNYFEDSIFGFQAREDFIIHFVGIVSVGRASRGTTGAIIVSSSMHFMGQDNCCPSPLRLDPVLAKKVRQMITEIQVDLQQKIRKDRQKIANYVRSQIKECSCQKYKPKKLYGCIENLRLKSREFCLRTIQADFARQATNLHLFYEIKCLKAEDQKPNDFYCIIQRYNTAVDIYFMNIPLAGMIRDPYFQLILKVEFAPKISKTNWFKKCSNQRNSLFAIFQSNDYSNNFPDRGEYKKQKKQLKYSSLKIQEKKMNSILKLELNRNFFFEQMFYQLFHLWFIIWSNNLQVLIHNYKHFLSLHVIHFFCQRAKEINYRQSFRITATTNINRQSYFWYFMKQLNLMSL